MKEDEIMKEDETVEDDGIVEEDETPKGLVIARILVGATIFLNMLNFARGVSVDTSTDPCGTAYAGYGIIQMFLLFILLCCVIPWIYLEFKNNSNTGCIGCITSLVFCVLSFVLCLALCRLGSNRPINQQRPETEEYSDSVAIEVIEEATETIEDEEDTLDFRP